ncbi:MAG: hydroxyacid dehydrogenase [Pseudomonadota bacterium]
MAPLILVLEDIHPEGPRRMADHARVEWLLGASRAEVLAAVADAEAIIVKSVTQVDEEMLAAAPRLRVVARAGSGTDNIDLAAAADRGVRVVTVPTGNTVAAAEFTVALMLMLCRRMPEVLARMSARDYRRHLLAGRELSGQTVGLVGLGNVGMAVAERLTAFGCRLLGFDPRAANGDAFERLGGRIVKDLDLLLPQVDILSLHVRLTPATRNMLGERALTLIKPGAMVVNTARGQVIDDHALLRALDEGRVSAAAVDVLHPEPPFDAEPGTTAYTHPLLGHPRILATPHVGASTEEAQRRISLVLADELAAILGKSHLTV